MKKAFSLLLIILSLLAFKNFAFAQPEVDACYNFYKARDYKRAIEAGKVAVQKYPNNIDAHYCLGISYRMVGEFKLALEHMKKAERLTSDKEALMHIYNRLGSIYWRMGYLDDALLYYSRSLSLARDLGNKSMQATVLNNIALIYDNKGEFDKALEYYEESLRLETDEKAKAATYNNIAFVYENKGDYQKAVEYLQKAIEISERYGDYHGASMIKVNLGNAYRKMKDYEKAEKYLLEGLEGVKKVGDKYWEASGYYGLGLLYRDKGDKKTAKDYLTRAYNLYKSIGAEGDAKEVLSEIQKLEKQRVAVYGGVEIGSKGVKAQAYRIGLKGDEFYDLQEVFRESINTTIIAGVKETGAFSKDGIEETAQAVKTLIEKLKEKGLPEDNIFVVASSAISSVKNRDELAKRVEELTGYKLEFLTVNDEVLFGIAGAVPPKYFYNSVFVDVGSGNTKIGYLEKVGGSINVKSLEIPYGTVSLTERASKGKDFRTELVEVLNKEVEPVLKREAQKNPAYLNRQNVFLVGGIVWAITTLQKPGQVEEAYVKLSSLDIRNFTLAVRQNPDRVLNPDLSKLKPELRDKAKKQIEKVKDVFSVDNLYAGGMLLDSIGKTLNFEKRNLIFPRYGNWLVGYVVLRGYLEETEAVKK
ncbi:tetratricopeptide repeat protein [Thermocrinis sp.]|jgi:tetratricopeptide (TPR) repeat protein|uniref:tetratricopeptide repeat protein n=1 Tax=Thermocrinis sp. TaxID=2024383 RepID=UPI002601AD83|nr:tetratricopeptide repeat protein [Thermocrinis sp.]